MRISALLFALSMSLLVSKTSLACSVCGCEPSGGTLGLDRPSMRDARLAAEDRYLWKESGSVVDNTREGERRAATTLGPTNPPQRRGFPLQPTAPFTPGRPTVACTAR